ncbi:MAG: formylglycine-generating enzyme family protein [Bacteroidales bacterium]|nr:formylglycine-generating enzyme family protein [Bacteroidales bacterium]
MRRRHFITMLLMGLFCAGAFPQQIMNVKFTQSGNQVIITYDITGSQPGQTFDNVQVFSSLDNYASPLRSVRGDIGTVTAGTGKRITWDVLSDRESLSATVSFEVRATPRVSKTAAPASASRPAPASDDYWVNIPGGTFMMGSPENEPQRNPNETQHQVTVSSFKLARYEVTFEEYDAYISGTRKRKPDDMGWGRGKRPVVAVTYEEAKAFAESKGCRLPTEAEWEYACRAGTNSPFYTGDNITVEQANFDGTEPYNNNPRGRILGKTQPVGSYAPNPWGLYDMHGNASEWVSDYYGLYEPGSQTDPKGPATGADRVRRGGSWWDNGARTRSAARVKWDPNKADKILGFRLASDN